MIYDSQREIDSIVAEIRRDHREFLMASVVFYPKLLRDPEVDGNGAEGEVDRRKVPRESGASGDRARDSEGRKWLSSTK
jgi:hypothetical protein